MPAHGTKVCLRGATLLARSKARRSFLLNAEYARLRGRLRDVCVRLPPRGLQPVTALSEGVPADGFPFIA